MREEALNSNNKDEQKPLDIDKYAISESFYSKLGQLHSILANSQHSIFILHDSDSDGLCSYLLLKNSYTTIQGAHFITKEIESQEIVLRQIPEDTTHIVCVDTPSVDESILDKLCQKYNVTILDHHTLDGNGEEKISRLEKTGNITYINPLNYNSKDSRPVTYFCYLLCEKTMKDIEYALIGTVADFYITPIFIDIYAILNNSNNTETDKQIEKNNPLSILFNHFNTFTIATLRNIVDTLNNTPLYFLEENNKKDNAKYIQMLTFSTQIGKLKFFFDFVFKNTAAAQESIHLIEQYSLYELIGEINAASHDLFFEFYKYYSKYQKIIQTTRNKFNALEQPQRYIIVEHKGKTSYNRQLSEQLLYELDVDIVFSMHQRFRRGFISGSFRSKPHINLHTILQEVFKEIDGANWGGHENACGCSFSHTDKEEIVKRFTKIGDTLKK